MKRSLPVIRKALLVLMIFSLGAIVLIMAVTAAAPSLSVDEETMVLHERMDAAVSDLTFDSSPQDQLQTVQNRFRSTRSLRYYADDLMIADTQMRVLTSGEWLQQGDSLNQLGQFDVTPYGASAVFMYQGDELVFCMTPITDSTSAVLLTHSALISYHNQYWLYLVVSIDIAIFAVCAAVVFFMIARPMNALAAENAGLQKNAEQSLVLMKRLHLQHAILEQESLKDSSQDELPETGTGILLVKDANGDPFQDAGWLQEHVPEDATDAVVAACFMPKMQAFFILCKPQADVKSLAPQLQNAYRDKTGCSVTAVSAGECFQLQDIHEICRQMQFQAMQRMFDGDGQVYEWKSGKTAAPDWKQLQDYQKEVESLTNSFYLKKSMDAQPYIDVLEKTRGNVTAYRAVSKRISSSLEQLSMMLQQEDTAGIQKLLGLDEMLPIGQMEQKIRSAVERLSEALNRSSQQNLLDYTALVNQEIEAAYADSQFGVSDIAEKVGVSSAYLSRIYKQACGATIIDQIQNCRMKEAVRLLQDSSLPTNEIYEHTGYSSNNYFYRVFKKRWGVTPGAFRQMNAEEQSKLMNERKGEAQQHEQEEE